MILWQRPAFEELAMNAEIGAYQPEPDDDGRGDPPFVDNATCVQALAPDAAGSG